jgi:hypothetical protein
MIASQLTTKIFVNFVARSVVTFVVEMTQCVSA